MPAAFDLDEIRRRVQAGHYEFKLHAQKRMAARTITVAEVETVIQTGEIIEQYPDATPLPKCLLLGYVRNSVPLYVSLAIGKMKVFVVTVQLVRSGEVDRSSHAQEVNRMEEKTELSECAECGGVTEPQTITVDQWWGEELFLFENVPVRICRDCGEIYLEAEVARRLESEMQTKSHCHRQVSVPVIAYQETAA